MIHLSGVSREFGIGPRPVRALDELTLEVPAGTALGLVGPNGAGKSTLVRLLLGYLRPSSGQISIANLAPRTYVERFGIGYVPEQVAIPPYWTARGALHAFAALAELERDVAERVDQVIQQWGLAPVEARRVKALSKGNLQRLALAQALLAPRKLLILDEPTDGLDPEWIARLRDILRDWRAADPERTLLIASHNLDEVERIADRVAVLRDGRLQEVVDLRAAPVGPLVYRLEVDGGGGERVHEMFASATTMDAGGWEVTAPDLAHLNRGIAQLITQGVLVRSFAPSTSALEKRVRPPEEAA